MYILWTSLALAFTCFQTVSAHSLPNQEKDTVIINFGNNSKIVIYVNNQEDFEALKAYDINAMLKDLSISIDSANEEYQVLKIEDNSGTRYLKDTTVVIIEKDDEEEDEGFRDIILVEEDSLDDVTVSIGKYRIKVRDREGTVAIEKKYVYKRTRHSFNIDLGMNNYLTNGKFPEENDELYSLKPFGSWYVGISSIRKTHVTSPLYLEWGGNISWYNFKFQNEQVRFEKEGGQVAFYEEDPALNGIKSKLTASYINLSFVPVLDFSSKNGKLENGYSYAKKGFRMGLGGYAGYRIGSKSKFVYKDGGREKDKNSDNFYLNNWRYGLRLQMGYRGLDLFVNYDMNDLFIENRGPQLNAFSFGITI